MATAAYSARQGGKIGLDGENLVAGAKVRGYLRRAATSG